MFDESLVQMKEEMIRDLCANLRIQSDAQPPEPGKPNGDGPARALEHVLRTASAMGFATKNVEGHAGCVDYGEGEEMIAVLGHLDVVPAGEGWTFPPYGGEVDGGRIYGRGALDNKGPMFAALYGLKAIKDSGLPLDRRIRLIFGTSEETTFADMDYYVTKEELPVAGFTPDSDFPVIYAEKGILHVTFSRTFSEMEETDISLESLQGGTVVNMVPDRASATLRLGGRRVNLETAGASAHGSKPEDGLNACFAMLAFLSHQDLPVVMQDAFSFLTYALTHETAGENLGLAMADEPSGPLSVNLGLLEGGPDFIRGSLDIRYPVTVSRDTVLALLEESFLKGGFDIESLSHKQPLYRPIDDPLVLALTRVFEEKTGIVHPPISTGGGTYARAMPNILAFGPCFPGDVYAFHQPDESITTDHLLLLSQIYAQAMYALAAPSR